MAATDPEIMQCMEVWGGNQSVDSGVVMAGLDAWVYCRPYAPQAASSPAAAAGGDVYFVSSCATGRITRLLVADVSGHGASVCDVATSLRQLMRKYVNYLDPLRFVGEMNRRFSEFSEAGCFATAIVTTFFAPTNHFTFCNAGHPPPLLYRAGKGWSYLQTQTPEDDAPFDLPLGVEDTSNYLQSEVTLRQGDMVLCYTDGLPESRGADGSFLDLQGLLAVVQGLDVSDPQRIVPSLLDTIAALYPDNLTSDDITVLLFRPNGIGKTTPLGTRLLAPFRLAGAIIRSCLPGGGPTPWPDAHPANMGGALIGPMNRLWKGRR